jgi:hypothetical protein
MRMIIALALLSALTACSTSKVLMKNCKHVGEELFKCEDI